MQVTEWQAYPCYGSSQRLPPVELHPNLYYLNGIEWAGSAMEMSSVAAKNIALLAYHRWNRQTDMVDQRDLMHRIKTELWPDHWMPRPQWVMWYTSECIKSLHQILSLKIVLWDTLFWILTSGKSILDVHLCNISFGNALNLRNLCRMLTITFPCSIQSKCKWWKSQIKTILMASIKTLALLCCPKRSASFPWFSVPSGFQHETCCSFVWGFIAKADWQFPSKKFCCKELLFAKK